MRVVATSDDFGSYYHDADTGRPLRYRLDTGLYEYSDAQLPTVNPQWTDLQNRVQSMYGDLRSMPSSVQTGTNDGYIIEWNQDPAALAAQQAAVADPAGFSGSSYNATAGYTPTIKNATYVPDWAQAVKDADNDSFGDMLPLVILAGVGIATGGFGLMGAAAESAALTGIEAGVMTAAEAAAAETAAMSAWAAAPASGMMESVLTNAAIGAGTSAIRGGDPLVGAITGGIGGAISASGALSDVSGGLISSTGAEGAAATAITKGVNAAATGAVGAAINGGSFEDVLASGVTSGLTSAAGNYVSGELRSDGSSGTLAGAAGGATAGVTNAVLTGGDITTGLITSGAAGAAAGAASDLGAGPATAGAVGSVVGSAVGSELAPEPVTPPPVTTTTTPPPPAADSGDLSWGDLTLNYVTQPRADMAWGTRLAGRV